MLSSLNQWHRETNARLGPISGFMIGGGIAIVANRLCKYPTMHKPWRHVLLAVSFSYLADCYWQSGDKRSLELEKQIEKLREQRVKRQELHDKVREQYKDIQAFQEASHAHA